MRHVTPALLFLTVALSACTPAAPEPLPLGQAVYERTIGGLACVDCHGATADAEPDEHWVPPAHALGGVAGRESLWDGRFDGDERLAQATAWCATRFQFRNAEDVEDDPRAVLPLEPSELDALVGYVAGFDGPSAPVELNPGADFYDALDLGGDLDRGEIVWHAACSICHGTEGWGGLGPPLRGPDWLDPFTVAEYVRNGTGWMPHYAPDRLDDQQLADLLSFMALWEE